MMEVLNNVLPFYVDYLGRFEYDKEENILSATDALSELLRSGVQQKLFIKNAEINFSDDRLIVTNSERVNINLNIYKLFKQKFYVVLSIP